MLKLDSILYALQLFTLVSCAHIISKKVGALVDCTVLIVSPDNDVSV